MPQTKISNLKCEHLFGETAVLHHSESFRPEDSANAYLLLLLVLHRFKLLYVFVLNDLRLDSAGLKKSK